MRPRLDRRRRPVSRVCTRPTPSKCWRRMRPYPREQAFASATPHFRSVFSCCRASCAFTGAQHRFSAAPIALTTCFVAFSQVSATPGDKAVDSKANDLPPGRPSTETRVTPVMWPEILGLDRGTARVAGSPVRSVSTCAGIVGCLGYCEQTFHLNTDRGSVTCLWIRREFVAWQGQPGPSQRRPGNAHAERRRQSGGRR